MTEATSAAFRSGESECEEQGITHSLHALRGERADVATQPRAGHRRHVMQVDGRRLPEADLRTHHDLARDAADGRGEGCDRHRGEAPDHLLAREHEDGPSPVGPRESELPDLASRYFGHRCAPSTGPNS